MRDAIEDVAAGASIARLDVGCLAHESDGGDDDGRQDSGDSEGLHLGKILVHHREFNLLLNVSVHHTGTFQA